VILAITPWGMRLRAYRALVVLNALTQLRNLSNVPLDITLQTEVLPVLTALLGTSESQSKTSFSLV